MNLWHLDLSKNLNRKKRIFQYYITTKLTTSVPIGLMVHCMGKLTPVITGDHASYDG